MKLIVGQSHTGALISARKQLGSAAYHDLEILNVNTRDRSIPVVKKIALGGYLPEAGKFTLVASMMGGNFYNTFGLIDNSVPFDFMAPGDSADSVASNRHLITYELLHCYFRDAMRRGFLKSILALKNFYNVSFIHIISPPPIRDNQHIIDNPGGYFSDKVHLGVAPASLRKKLYRLHTRVLVEFCHEHGIPTLPPPPDAVTEDGFLARPFWENDPTHANAAYGRLVLEQLRGYRP